MNAKLFFPLIPLLLISSAFSLMQSQYGCEAQGYNWMDNSNYPGTYSFTDDAVGSAPLGFTALSSGASCTSKVVQGIFGHNKVLEFFSATGEQYRYYNELTHGAQAKGTVEFWMSSTNTTKQQKIYLGNSTALGQANIVLYVGFWNGYLVVNQEASWDRINVIPVKDNTWYHMRIDFDCLSEYFDLYINGLKYGPYRHYYYLSQDVNTVSHITFKADDIGEFKTYFDAIGYSWDPNYKIGDNLMGGCCGDDIIDLRNGLVSEWHFDEGTGAIAYDNLSNNHISLTGQDWISGVHGSAIDLNAGGDKGNFNLPSDIALDGFSFSLWLNWKGHVGSSWPNHASVIFIAGNNHGVSGNNLELIIDPAPDNFLNWRSFTQTNSDPRISVQPNTLYHVAGTIDSTGLRKLYINGTLVGTSLNTLPTSLAATTGFLGVYPTNIYYFKGLIDEFRVYDRALSDREVAYLYEMSPYKYIEYPDTFHNGTANVDASYCVNNDFYANLEQSSQACNEYSFNFLQKDWRDYGFNYRKNITIANSGTALADYQISINPSTYNTTGLVASYHFNNEEEALIKDYSGSNNHGSLYGSTVGLWRFDEGTGASAYDSSSNSLTATLSGAAFNSTSIKGYSLRFNMDDSVSIVDNDKLSFTDGAGNDKPFSLSYWVKPESTGNQWLINKRSATGTEWQMYLYNGALGFTCFGSGGSTEYITANITNPLALNLWNHISATYDGSELSTGMNIYINGVLLATTQTKSAGYTGMSNTVSNLVLGMSGWNPGLYLNGSMDELAIYNKKLSAEEIKYLYNSQKAQFIEYNSGYEDKGTGLEFDGISNYANTNIDLTDYDAYSVSVWFKRAGKASREIIIAQDQVSDRVFTLEYDASLLSGSRLYAYDGVNTLTGNDIDINKWVNVVIIKTGSSTYFYQNGALVNSGAGRIPASSSQTLKIGYRAYTGANDPFNGTIDQVKIFNRILTAQEVQDIYDERYGRLDYADIRFFDNSGEELSHYHEYDNSFWAKVPSLPIGQSNITMHYGNPGAISKSNEYDFNISCPAAGGNISIKDGYCIHAFYSSGTFSPTKDISAEILVVAGGGGGAAMTGGGGGAGGLIHEDSYAILKDAIITSTVGTGGAGQVGSANPGWGSNGQNSSFGTLIAAGGGAGGTNAATYGNPGGSGGSCGHAACVGGLGTLGQGYSGGSQDTTTPNYGAGGGGGAGQAGFGGTNTAGGNGGNGLAFNILGTTKYYAGGGGGGTYMGGTLGLGGLGGGGNAPAGHATANTGGGGGGQRNNLANGGNGGSGIIIVKYPQNPEISIIQGFEENILDDLNYGCCGNDGLSDIFYNGTINTTNHFCHFGEYINQGINDNESLCSYYGNDWIIGSSGDYASCCGPNFESDNFFNETLACVKGELCEGDIDFGLDEEYGTIDDACGCENEGSACLFSQNYNQSQGTCISNSCQTEGFFEQSEFIVSKIEYSSLYSNSISEIKVYMKNIGLGPGAILKATINGLNVTSINYESLVFPNQEQIISIKAFMPCSQKGAINKFNFTIEYNDFEQRAFESIEYEIISDNPLSIEFLSGHQETGYINLNTNDFEAINYFIKNNAAPSIEATAQNIQSASIFSRTITYKGEYQGQGINNETFIIPQNSAMIFSTRIYPTLSGQSGSYLLTFQDKSCEYNKISLSYGYDTSSQTSGAISVMVADEKISIISIIILSLILDKFLIKKKSNNS